MPRGPKGERRPADVIGNAVKVMRISTGQEPEDYGPSPESRGRTRLPSRSAGRAERRGQRGFQRGGVRRSPGRRPRNDGRKWLLTI